MRMLLNLVEGLVATGERGSSTVEYGIRTALAAALVTGAVTVLDEQLMLIFDTAANYLR